MKDAQRAGTGVLGKEFQSPLLKVTLLEGPDGPPVPGATYGLKVRPTDDVEEDVSKNLSITVPKAANSGLSTDAVRTVAHYRVPRIRSPHAKLRDFVDKLMRGFLERRQSWKTEEASSAESFLTDQIRRTRDSLDQAERALGGEAILKKNSSVVVLGDEAQGVH